MSLTKLQVNSQKQIEKKHYINKTKQKKSLPN